MNVPILDEAYMERRHQLRRIESWADYYRRVDARSLPETAATLREEYARGDITFEEFERRLEAVLA